MIPEPSNPGASPSRGGRLRWTPLRVTALGVTGLLVGLFSTRPESTQAEPHSTAAEVTATSATPSTNSVTDPVRIPAARAAVSPEVAALRQDIRKLIPDWTSARWSILVVSLERGDTLFHESPARPLVPASGMKLVTTAAAFHHLGADFQFRTMALTENKIEDGRIQGDLILRGTGDPGLSDRMYPSHTSVFEQLATQLSNVGIVSISGDIVGDGSYFDGPLLGPEWHDEDLNEWFAAPVSALTFNENIVTLQIAPSRTIGGSPQVTEFPQGSGFTYSNRAKTVSGRPRPQLWLDRSSPGATIRIHGDIRSSANPIWRRLTVPDPVLFAARGFRDVLEDRGIRVDGEATTRASSPFAGPWFLSPHGDQGWESLNVLASVKSPILLEYLTVINHVSHNLFAEAVFKVLGRVTRREGSFRGGARAVRDYLHRQAGVSLATVQVRDGSGLSPSNAMSAGAFIRILQYMAASKNWNAFQSTLPLAGRQRGLRRMYRTPAAGNLRAKTGTMDGVSSLTGIVRSATGETLLFSIISNGVRSTSAAKRVEDRIGARLAEFRRPTLSDAEASSADLTPTPSANWMSATAPVAAGARGTVGR